MIITFKCAETKKIYQQEFSKKFPTEIQSVAFRKLMMIQAAGLISDLRVPPGNHLEKLVGDRDGDYSIKINDQYRICFRWTNGGGIQGAVNVEIVDYH